MKGERERAEGALIAYKNRTKSMPSQGQAFFDGHVQGERTARAHAVEVLEGEAGRHDAQAENANLMTETRRRWTFAATALRAAAEKLQEK